MSQKILVIDDAERLRQHIEKVLVRAGFSVVTAANGSDGLLLLEETNPDLVLTDAHMPGLNGHALCRVLRKRKNSRQIPIIIMSGEMMEERDIVAGLEGGADDYVLKPFAPSVLLARIRAVLRRYQHEPAAKAILKKYGIGLDPAAREVKVEGKPVALSRKEFDVLGLLLVNAGRVVSANFLLESVWAYDLADYNDPHTVETHISSLRKKLGRKAAAHLVTVRGCGYKFG